MPKELGFNASYRVSPDLNRIDKLIDVTKQVEGHTICALGDAAAWPIQSAIKRFPEDFKRRLVDGYST